MIRALILAAGRGSRMNSMTQRQPKCFVKLHGKRLIDWQLDALNAAGLEQIAIVRGYQAQMFTYPYRYFDNPRWHETNMVRSLWQAKEILRDDTCVISYSDIVYSPLTVKRLIDKEIDEDIAITYDPDWLKLWTLRFSDPLSDAETFKLDEQEYVVEIGNKPKSVEEVAGQYMGLLRLTANGWLAIENYLNQLESEVVDKMDMTSLLRQLILVGIKVKGIKTLEPWYEVDNENDLRIYHGMAEQCLFEKRAESK